jgi:hypothetical protein
MNNLPVLSEYFEGEPISIRAADGYWDATAMCQRYRRLFADFYRLKTTNAYLVVASDNMGIPIDSLVEVSPGRNSRTWVHPRVALKLAAWLNPVFEFWVYSTIEKLLTEGKVELQEQLACYEKMLNTVLYDRDELRRELPWHRQNSWGAPMDDVTPHD